MSFALQFKRIIVIPYLYIYVIAMMSFACIELYCFEQCSVVDKRNHKTSSEAPPDEWDYNAWWTKCTGRCRSFSKQIHLVGGRSRLKIHQNTANYSYSVDVSRAIHIHKEGPQAVNHDEGPRAGSGVVRMDPLRFLAGCRTRRLNQA